MTPPLTLETGEGERWQTESPGGDRFSSSIKPCKGANDLCSFLTSASYLLVFNPQFERCGPQLMGRRMCKRKAIGWAGTTQVLKHHLGRTKAMSSKSAAASGLAETISSPFLRTSRLLCVCHQLRRDASTQRKGLQTATSLQRMASHNVFVGDMVSRD